MLKLYPPHEREHAEVEARVLGVVEGRLPIATPRVLAVGEQDGWPYLLMSRLPGRRLVEAWPTLDARDRDRVADETGAALAALHGLDIAPVATLPPDWDAFVAAQRAQRRRTPARTPAGAALAGADRPVPRGLDAARAGAPGRCCTPRSCAST